MRLPVSIRAAVSHQRALWLGSGVTGARRASAWRSGSARELLLLEDMSMTTILIIVLIVLLLGGGGYFWRGRG